MPQQQVKFSVNTWAHLYSLSQAVKYQTDNSGRCLQIKGKLTSSEWSASAQNIQLHFIHSNDKPHYKLDVEQRPVFGQLMLDHGQLTATITVPNDSFNELKKNLIEYADIEGIHIVFSLELTPTNNAECWDIIELDYAMKGDR